MYYIAAPHDEITGLANYLDQQLSAIRASAYGLTDEQARQTPCRSSLSIGGIVKHIAYGLRGYAATMRQSGRADISDDDYAAYGDSLALSDSETMADVLAEFDAARAEILDLFASSDPDADFLEPPAPWFGQTEAHPTKLRYFLVHQIEEAARHAGHADIIREQLDAEMVPNLQMTIEGVPANDFFTPYEPAPGTLGAST